MNHELQLRNIKGAFIILLQHKYSKIIFKIDIKMYILFLNNCFNINLNIKYLILTQIFAHLHTKKILNTKLKIAFRLISSFLYCYYRFAPHCKITFII